MPWYRDVYLRSEDWKNLRIAMLHSANNKCEACSTSRSLDVHHINYRKLYDVSPEDLVVLCRDCHNKAHEILDNKSDAATSILHDIDKKIAGLESKRKEASKFIKENNRKALVSIGLGIKRPQNIIDYIHKKKLQFSIDRTEEKIRKLKSLANKPNPHPNLIRGIQELERKLLLDKSRLVGQ